MPLSSSDFIAQARRHLAEDQFALVLEQTEAALANDSQADDLLLLKAESLLGLGRFADALPLGMRFVTTAPGEAESWLLLCRALHELGFDDLALRANAFALIRAAPDFEALCFAGDTLYASNRFDEARAAYERALQAFGSQPRAWRQWYNYSTCLYAAGRVADSEAADRRALRGLQQLLAIGNVTSEKRLAALWFHQGMLYFRLKQWDLAEETFSRSLRSDARSISALWLRNTYRKAGKRIVATLMLPWAARNKWLEIRREGTALDNKTWERASISSETLSEIEQMIAN